METRTFGNLTVCFDAGEEGAAELIASACEQSLGLIRDLWALEAPEDCWVYVMTSWPRTLFHAAPWPWRVYLAITLPLRYARIQKVWEMAGGWTQRYGQRRVIGIKPPRLLWEVDAGLRERIFVRRDADEWVQHNACHELVHACSDHLRLPTWLHEGLAMVTVDRFAGRPTVKAETLAALASGPGETGPRGRVGALSADPEALVYLAVRGYWITRYLAEVEPALLKGQLARPQSHEALEGALAAGLGMNGEEFRDQIDAVVATHFEEGENG
jgi:hypothetical protein